MGKKIFIEDEHAAKAETLGEVLPNREVRLLPTQTDELESLAQLGDPQASKDPAEQATSGIHPSDFSMVELAQILDQHKLWVESGGDSGTKADLSAANLQGADLTGVNLQGALLSKANFTGADLSMANLRGANLVHADLRNTTLLGTELRGANLMGATLYGAEGLWAGRLGGTNLFDALLPESVAEFSTANPIADASKVARLFYFLTLAVSIVCCLLIVSTNDVRLLLNASAFPIASAGNVLPMAGFYLGGPLLLFALYLRFHFLLLRLWGSIAALPAVFPDGQTPERDGPWFLMGLIRKHFRWLRDGRSPLAALETSVSMVLGYWIVPATLLLFWVRYLVRQDFRGTLLQVLLITVSVAAATGLPSIVARVLRPGEIRIPKSKNFFRLVLRTTRAALITGAFLLLVSLGVNKGLPADRDIAPEHSSAHIGRWAAQMFQSVGYRPYADVTEAVISTPPAAGNWTEEGMASAPGARLNQMNLRFARAYRSFLMNAKLWRADLEGAYLSEADLRGANLREAGLRSANLDRAQANHAVFVSADAVGSKFVSTDLRGADLSYGNFDNADFSNAKMAGSSLYAVSMRGARLLRTDLPRTDLRDSKLEHAVLSFANLQEADLSSANLGGASLAGAQLKGTILLDADLKGADLRGAFLGGSLLRGAELNGANLARADLHGVAGLSAEQVCSARWQDGLLDAELLGQVQARCGAPGVSVAVPAPQTIVAPATASPVSPAAVEVPKPATVPTAAAAPAAKADLKPAPPVMAATGAKPKTADPSKPKGKTPAVVGTDAAKKKEKPLTAGQDNAKAKAKAAQAADSDTAKSKKKAGANPKPKANAAAKPDTDQQ
ncbi:MAG: pentapeptide repeat-containing protein [Acidobacteriota bacterium]|nr:pentapeptide repeat-containing protein [Acidobacteriota bacterium]